MRLSCIQSPPRFLHLEESLERADDAIRSAASRGAELVVFPETWLPGYPIWVDEAPDAARWGDPGARALHRALLENSVEVGGAPFRRLCEMASSHGVHLSIGLHEREGGSLYNSLLHVAPDGPWFLHRKLVPTHGERLVWGRGDGSTLGVLETPFGMLGGLICWEHWMPLARAAQQAHRETVHVAAWPWVKELHLQASRTYAFEARCFVVAAGTALQRSELLEGSSHLPGEARRVLEAMPGDPEDWLLAGGSAVIGPEGDVLCGPAPPEASAIDIEIDPRCIAEALQTFDSQGHYARPDVLRLEVDTRKKTSVVFDAEQP